ncbi:MAG: nuclear transport factor 2 family protein [Steroidobacteraceae bacterium]|jgi:ketosteroid isomerase-like protein|nr:nuclear transport factor 2 family protein [Steroidobacteraceae bacterium]
MKAFVLQMFEAIDGGHWDRLPEFFHSDVTYDRPGYPTIRGFADLDDFYRRRRIIRSGRHTVEDVVVDGERAVATGELTATLNDGREVRLRFADAYRFADGKVAYRQTYFGTPAV